MSSLVEVRDRRTGKLLCKVDPTTGRVQVSCRGRLFWVEIPIGGHCGVVYVEEGDDAENEGRCGPGAGAG
jgi:hypothetical protein